MAVSLKVVKELPRKEMVFALAHVPGGRRLIFGGSDFGCTTWIWPKRSRSRASWAAMTAT